MSCRLYFDILDWQNAVVDVMFVDVSCALLVSDLVVIVLDGLVSNGRSHTFMDDCILGMTKVNDAVDAKFSLNISR